MNQLTFSAIALLCVFYLVHGKHETKGTIYVSWKNVRVQVETFVSREDTNTNRTVGVRKRKILSQDYDNIHTKCEGDETFVIPCKCFAGTRLPQYRLIVNSIFYLFPCKADHITENKYLNYFQCADSENDEMCTIEMEASIQALAEILKEPVNSTGPPPFETCEVSGLSGVRLIPGTVVKATTTVTERRFTFSVIFPNLRMKCLVGLPTDPSKVGQFVLKNPPEPLCKEGSTEIFKNLVPDLNKVQKLEACLPVTAIGPGFISIGTGFISIG